MPAIATKECPACKRRHIVCLADADRPEPDRNYSFSCRAEGIAVRWVFAAEECKSVEAKPDGAVVLNQM